MKTKAEAPTAENTATLSAMLGGRVKLTSVSSDLGLCSLPVAKKLCRKEVQATNYLTVGGEYYVDAEAFQKVYLAMLEAKRKKSLATTKKNGLKRKAINKLVKAGASLQEAKQQVEAQATASPKA